MIVAGLILLGLGDPAELAEFVMPFAHVVSYARITAVLLAKGGWRSSSTCSPSVPSRPKRLTPLHRPMDWLHTG